MLVMSCKAGQVIAQINGSDTSAQLQNAEGAVKAAQSAYNWQKPMLNGTAKLYAQQAISKLQLDQVKTNWMPHLLNYNKHRQALI